MSCQQPRQHNYKTLKTLRTFKVEPIKEKFSLRAAVRQPYGKCWGGRKECNQPKLAGVT